MRVKQHRFECTTMVSPPRLQTAWVATGKYNTPPPGLTWTWARSSTSTPALASSHRVVLLSHTKLQLQVGRETWNFLASIPCIEAYAYVLYGPLNMSRHALMPFTGSEGRLGLGRYTLLTKGADTRPPARNGGAQSALGHTATSANNALYTPFSVLMTTRLGVFELNGEGWSGSYTVRGTAASLMR